MSTILKALRRLEEDTSIEATSSAGSLPATDPQATDELRSRILAEELAAEAGGTDTFDRSDSRKPILMIAAAAAIAALILGLGIRLFSPAPEPGDESETSLAASPPNPAVPLVVHPDPSKAEDDPMEGQSPDVPDGRQLATPGTRPAPTLAPTPAMNAASPNSVASNAQRAAPSPIRLTSPLAASTPGEEMALGAVTPTAAVLESQSAASSSAIPHSESPKRSASSTKSPVTRPPTRPTPTLAERRATNAEVAVSAAKPARESTAAEVATTTPSEMRAISTRRDTPKTSGETRPGARAESKAKPEVPVVKEHKIRGLPDVAVLRTAWHPNPDRRSAKIRIVGTNETLTLKEGDAVGALVIKEISPSAVLFQSGEVEVRLRVGQPGSGG